MTRLSNLGYKNLPEPQMFSGSNLVSDFHSPGAIKYFQFLRRGGWMLLTAVPDFLRLASWLLTEMGRAVQNNRPAPFPQRHPHPPERCALLLAHVAMVMVSGPGAA